ncbi:sensor histidine kinase [Nocardia anaemiae]|uniref:sensor histidine kinase n=1 Tax=Nocardia anaemiae TaxID=263910 RepID=UPI0007A425F3|nr:histidine kinase [Nocardia anaemiae]
MVSVDDYAVRHPQVTDAVIVMALLGAAVLGVYMVGPGEPRTGDPWPGVVVTGLACLAAFGAREHPRITVVAATACTLAAGGLGYLLTPLLLAPVMVALYWLAVTTSSRATWAYGGTATVLVVGVAVGTDLDAMLALRAVGPALWLILPLALGSRTRLRHAYLDAVHARAEHAERARDEEARLRVTEERIRIARDLHDIVAHHMAVANAQAGTAAHLLASQPALTRQILTELQTTTATAMLELRDTVGVLRRSTTDTDTVEPVPGLAQLPGLLQTCRSAGLAVDLHVEGQPRELPPGIDLTAYRIIQEALTNATKHAASAAATLHVRYGTTDLTITVSNATHEGHRSHPGYGIIGMRERANTVGGELRVTDKAADFEVAAILPLSNHPVHTPQAAQ